MAGQRKPNSKIFYGWFVLGGLFFVAAVGPMGRYILSALAPFLMRDPGWSRHTIGMAFTLHFWAYAFIAIITGRLLDTIGGRGVIICGGVLMLIGLLLLSRVHHTWTFFLTFGIVLSLAVSMTHFLPNTAIVRKWFIKKAGLATGLVTVGTVAGLGIIPPVITHFSARIGWRNATMFCGFAFATIILLSALLIIRNTPESIGLQPDGEKPMNNPHSPILSAEQVSFRGPGPRLKPINMIINKNFLYFFIAYSVTGIPLQGILSHIGIWGVSLGVSAAGSGAVMTALTLPSVPVRILAGWLGDRFGKKQMLLLFNAYNIAVWIFGWYLVKDTTSYLVFILLVGLAYSAPFSLFTPFLGDLFGRAVVGSLLGISTLGHGVIGGLGPYIWGWIADKTGTYSLVCPLSAACYVVVTISILLIEKPPKQATS